MQGTDLPSRLFETGSDDDELYEEDEEFVLLLPVTTGATARGTPVEAVLSGAVTEAPVLEPTVVDASRSD